MRSNLRKRGSAAPSARRCTESMNSARDDGPHVLLMGTLDGIAQLDNLVSIKKLSVESCSSVELDGMLRSGRSRIADAERRELSFEQIRSRMALQQTVTLSPSEWRNAGVARAETSSAQRGHDRGGWLPSNPRLSAAVGGLGPIQIASSERAKSSPLIAPLR